MFILLPTSLDTRKRITKNPHCAFYLSVFGYITYLRLIFAVKLTHHATLVSRTLLIPPTKNAPCPRIIHPKTGGVNSKTESGIWLAVVCVQIKQTSFAGAKLLRNKNGVLSG